MSFNKNEELTTKYNELLDLVINKTEDSDKLLAFKETPNESPELLELWRLVLAAGAGVALVLFLESLPKPKFGSHSLLLLCTRSSEYSPCA